MNEYLEQSLLNCINSIHKPGRPTETDSQWIADEDDSCYYMEGHVNGIYSRWTIEK